MDAVKLKIKKSAYLRRLSEISSTLRAYEQAKEQNLDANEVDA